MKHWGCKLKVKKVLVFYDYWLLTIDYFYDKWRILEEVTFKTFSGHFVTGSVLRQSQRCLVAVKGMVFMGLSHTGQISCCSKTCGVTFSGLSHTGQISCCSKARGVIFIGFSGIRWSSHTGEMLYVDFCPVIWVLMSASLHIDLKKRTFNCDLSACSKDTVFSQLVYY